MISIWSNNKKFYIEYNQYTLDAMICDEYNGIIAIGKKSKLEKQLNSL